jgi:hypothetical protein
MPLTNIWKCVIQNVGWLLDIEYRNEDTHKTLAGFGTSMAHRPMGRCEVTDCGVNDSYVPNCAILGNYYYIGAQDRVVAKRPRYVKRALDAPEGNYSSPDTARQNQWV